MTNSYTDKQITESWSSAAQSSSCDYLDQPHLSQQFRAWRVPLLSVSADNGVQLQAGALLEERPSRVTFDDHQVQEDICICSSVSHKVVSFSSRSRLHVYPVDEDERLKSYSPSERKLFQAQTLHNAFRIQELVQSCPYEGGAAIRYLIRCNLIGSEELLGIENLIVGAGKISKERRVHSRLVVDTQRELQKDNDENIGQKLADVSTARSLKSFEKARLRAALAA